MSDSVKVLLTLWEGSWDFLAEEVPIDLDIYPNQTLKAFRDLPITRLLRA